MLLGVTALAVLLSVLVVRLHFTPGTLPVPLIFAALARPTWFQAVKVNPCSAVEDTKVDTEPVASIIENDQVASRVEVPRVENAESVSWPLVAVAVDRLCFSLFTVIIAVTSVVILPYIVYKGNASTSTN